MKATTHGFLGIALVSLGVLGVYVFWGIIVGRNSFFLGAALTVIASGLPDMDIFLLGKRRHRGITHSLLACIVLFLLLLYLYVIEPGTVTFSILFWLGYVCHICLDLLSSTGVQLLWPSKKRFLFLQRKQSFVQRMEPIIVIISILITVMVYLIFIGGGVSHFCTLIHPE